MIGAISAELLKLRKSWSTWILGGVLVLGLLLLGYLLIYLLVQNPPPGDRGAQAGIAALRRPCCRRTWCPTCSASWRAWAARSHS